MLKRNKTISLILQMTLFLLFSLTQSGCGIENNLITGATTGAGDPASTLEFSLNLKPASDNGYNITKIIVSVLKDDVEYFSKDITVTEQTATGSFENLLPGTHIIQIKAYEYDVMVAEEIKEYTVSSEEKTIIDITLDTFT